jgi:dephospho-CoA kinase
VKNRIIGLTGPVAAGKDAAVKFLKRKGAIVIDADELAHKLYLPQTPLWRELFKRFGSKILKRGGEINRKKLGAIVFSDQKKLKDLDKIIHPALKEAITKEIDRIISEQRTQIIVVNAAVLKEIGLVDQVDAVWVVMASKANRLKRLRKSGMSEAEAMKRINAQLPQKDYLKMADVVIRNDGTLNQLNAKVQAGLKF